MALPKIIVDSLRSVFDLVYKGKMNPLYQLMQVT